MNSVGIVVKASNDEHTAQYGKKVGHIGYDPVQTLGNSTAVPIMASMYSVATDHMVSTTRSSRRYTGSASAIESIGIAFLASHDVVDPTLTQHSLYGVTYQWCDVQQSDQGGVEVVAWGNEVGLDRDIDHVHRPKSDSRHVDSKKDQGMAEQAQRRHWLPRAHDDIADTTLSFRTDGSPADGHREVKDDQEQHAPPKMARNPILLRHPKGLVSVHRQRREQSPDHLVVPDRTHPWHDRGSAAPTRPQRSPHTHPRLTDDEATSQEKKFAEIIPVCYLAKEPELHTDNL